MNPRQLLSDNLRFIDDFMKNSVDDKGVDYEKKNCNTETRKSLNNRNLNEIEIKIISCLKGEEKTIDEISKASQISPSCLIEYITSLEIEGLIRALSGGRFGAVKGV
ncbi:MAG: hypothetical protein AB7V16_10270 [Vulcanibacillus sp.]